MKNCPRGTPAYMAPEQLDGSAVTVQSDLYSLGLVLYEIFTGKKAFEASSLNELIKLRRSDTTPTTPTSIVKDLDPVIERVIDRCIQKDPSLRPSSALQVSAALPGGDPIAAALAAGETPSPEMVAAAPKIGTLRPAVALALIAAVLILLLLPVLLSKQVATHRLIPLETPPEVLKQRASDMAKSFGYTQLPADNAYGFRGNRNYYAYLVEHRRTLKPWEVLRHGQPGLIGFWYRQSSGALVPYSQQFVTLRDPPTQSPGMVHIVLDTEGKLTYFEAVPDQVHPQTTSAKRLLGGPAIRDTLALSESQPGGKPAGSPAAPSNASSDRRSIHGRGFFKPQVWISVSFNRSNLSGRRLNLTTLVVPGQAFILTFRRSRFGSKVQLTRADRSTSRLSVRGAGLWGRLSRRLQVKSLRPGCCWESFSALC